MDKYNHWLPKFIGKIKGYKRFAITIGQTAYYSVGLGSVLASPGWVRHENKHKEQWRKEGALKFITKYLYYQVRYGYKSNPYEVEARLAEKG